MAGSRFILFLTLALSIWGTLHLYVFWRLSSIPWITGRISGPALTAIGVTLWLSYFVVRATSRWNLPAFTYLLELLSTTWIGFLFLLFSAFLFVDVVTLGGMLLPHWAPFIRSGAVVIAGVLGVIALIQGLRPPVVTCHEIRLTGLTTDQDGTTLVVVSDFHLGRQLGGRWFRERVAQIEELQPDCILAVGDVVDGSAHELRPLVPALRTLTAPMGVWAVSGNHEFYEGLDHSLAILKEAGWNVLRDEATQIAPGLVLAGVDDLTARGSFGEDANPVEQALKNRPDGVTILMSHSPMQVRTAAELGCDLMLSGHTHGGQIWPFNYLVGLRYPLVSGRHAVEGMHVIIGRGTGTWGPRMRLWHRGEILQIVLKSG